MFLSAQFNAAQQHKNAALGFIPKPYETETVLKTIEMAKTLMSGGLAPERLPPGLELFR